MNKGASTIQGHKKVHLKRTWGVSKVKLILGAQSEHAGEVVNFFVEDGGEPCDFC